jgi:branched-chain amino acid transport system permease protein
MKRFFSLSKILSVAAIIGILLLSIWGETHLDPYTKRLLHMWGIYSILVASFNLIYGFTGQFSMAHAGLAAIGAYVVSLLTLSPATKAVSFFITPPIWPISVIEWPFLPSLIIAGILTAVVGFLIGAPALRLHGDYLLIVTFGFSEIIRLILVNLPMVCNGAIGLKGIPRYSNLTWIAGLTIAVLIICKRFIDSSYGRALRCIKEDEIAAEAVGVNLFKHKLMSFVVSSLFVGIAGGLFAEILGTIDPNTFRPYLTYAVITMAVLGGIESLTGGVIAAGVYTVMSELLRTVETPRVILNIEFPGVPGLRMLAFSVMLLLLILFARKGLMGDKEFSWNWVISRINLIGQKFRGGKIREYSGD